MRYLHARVCWPDDAALLLQNVSNEALEESDVFSIIRTLYFEGKIDIMNGEDGDVYRPAMLPIPETSALTSVPCGVCPVCFSAESAVDPFPKCSAWVSRLPLSSNLPTSVWNKAIADHSVWCHLSCLHSQGKSSVRSRGTHVNP